MADPYECYSSFQTHQETDKCGELMGLSSPKSSVEKQYRELLRGFMLHAMSYSSQNLEGGREIRLVSTSKVPRHREP